MSKELTPENILQFGLGYWGSKSFLSAIELGLVSELAKGPLNLDAVRARLKLHARSVRDFLDALVAMRMLERNADGKYSNTPETDLFLDRAKPSYVGGLLEMANTRLYPNWGRLTEALRTGQPQNGDENGVDPFAALYADPQKVENFLSAMTAETSAPPRVHCPSKSRSRIRTSPAAASISTQSVRCSRNMWPSTIYRIA